MCEFQSGIYKSIYIFAEKTADSDGWIRLNGPGGRKSQVHMGDDAYRLIQLPLEAEGGYRLDWENVRISQMYLSDCPDLLERGVMFLNPDTGEAEELGAWYDTPWREQYHFSPFVNWANDPNGLCWFKGYYHLFYQANPFGQKWNDMYWGHTVSRDLMHWIHLPHVLEPQHYLWNNTERKGGAFSGSALAEHDKIRLFLTRHDGPQEDGTDTREWQTSAVCRDGIHVAEEKELITEKPEGASFDFRDPKAELIDGNLYLVLGSSIGEVPSILLYRKTASGTWEYEGPLLQEKTPGIRTFECPDFFKLDGRYVALGAWMCHYDEAGRYQMTRCYVGDFNGGRLHAVRQQWYDFGSNFYAVQSFEHEGRRIAIGWASDFMMEHREQEGGAYGSFALPRELHVRNDRLYMEPVKECYNLLGENQIRAAGSAHVKKQTIPGNSYYVKLRINGDGDFKLLLAQDGDDTLTLERTGGVTELVSTKKETEGVRFPSGIDEVREIEVFVDRRLTEVFLNHGEAAGTKLFYQDSTEGCFEADFCEGELEQLEVYRMQSIWSENRKRKGELS